MKVMDGAERFRVSLDGLYLGPMAIRAARDRVSIPSPASVAAVPPLMAFVDRRQWLVLCPDCPGAEHVWRKMPVVMCQSCWNQAVGGLWRPVEFPKDMKEIEAALEERVLPDEHAWRPPETVNDLKGQNAVMRAQRQMTAAMEAADGLG